MARLSTLKPRIASLPSRLKPPAADRQATRSLTTSSKEWRELRFDVLIRDKFRCQAKGCTARLYGKGAAQVDHINGDSSDNRMANLQALCPPCHSRKTVQEDHGFGFEGRDRTAKG